MTVPERSSLKPPEEASRWPAALAILAALLLAAGGWWWWQKQHWVPAAASVPAEVPSAASMAPDAAPVPAGDTASDPQNPMDVLAEPDAQLPALTDADAHVTQALDALLGNSAMAQFVQTDGLVRRFVATVDNLAREQAPARIWPVQPTMGKFTINALGDGEAIALDNGARYGPLVQWIEAVDLKSATALYARLYPLFQQAYEELGFPQRYFNDRLVAVLDHLLQAPEPSGPIYVTLTDVRGDVPSTRPWVRYEFVDPNLQALSSGQKIMVRVGLVNERRLKKRLRELRALVATGAVADAKP